MHEPSLGGQTIESSSQLLHIRTLELWRRYTHHGGFSTYLLFTCGIVGWIETNKIKLFVWDDQQRNAQ